MEYVIVFVTLGLALVLFSWGKIRYDLVALICLFILVLFGSIAPQDALLGFGHPAVVTVAAVLIISRALQDSGLVEIITKGVSKIHDNFKVQIIVLTFLVGIISAFMNNVGALAIMLPVAIHLARKSGHPASHILMPIAFASLLGGMTTLIGTPPNIIISTFRQDATGSGFALFDFTPVGAVVAVVGMLFIAVIGWRLVPVRKGQRRSDTLFHIEDYLTEVRVVSDSKILDMCVCDIEKLIKNEVRLIGLVRKNHLIHNPDSFEVLKNDDVLIIEAETRELEAFIAQTGVKLVGGKKFLKDALNSKDIVIAEAVVMDDSPLVGETAESLHMRSRFGINLLAVAQHEKQIRMRIDEISFRVGDVLLLEGHAENIHDAIASMKCLPLAERGVKIGKKRKTITALSIFGFAIAVVFLGIVPIHIMFPIAALILVLTNILPLRDVYTSIDWPVIVLLGAMIPVGNALETSGGAELIAQLILSSVGSMPIWLVLGLMLTVTMLLSNILNNAATVVLMAPIGISIAYGLNASIDPFLMAIAIGASCAFLTPIGHQSNTLVMGPGGYKFSDYWRMGLPLQIVVLVCAIPLILFFWPV